MWTCFQSGRWKIRYYLTWRCSDDSKQAFLPGCSFFLTRWLQYRTVVFSAITRWPLLVPGETIRDFGSSRTGSMTASELIWCQRLLCSSQFGTVWAPLEAEAWARSLQDVARYYRRPSLPCSYIASGHMIPHRIVRSLPSIQTSIQNRAS